MTKMKECREREKQRVLLLNSFSTYLRINSLRILYHHCKWESESLFTEPKNELHEHTNTHISKQNGFVLEKREVQSSQHRHGEG